MSRAFGLVKFIDTGNIYMGVYDGTCDVFYAKIFTAEECYDEKTDWYNCFAYIDKLLENDGEWEIKKLSPVEIYSDYGGGFWWKGFGDESQKLIDFNSCDSYRASTDAYSCSDDIEVFNGAPDWARKFMEEMG